MRKNPNWEKIKGKLKSYSTYVGIALVLLFILSLVRNFSKIGGAKKRIDAAQERVTRLKEENEEAKKRLAEVKGEEYIEKQLRDKLGLAKEGEIVIVLPDEETLRKIAPTLAEEEDVLPDPTWKKWLKLFF